MQYLCATPNKVGLGTVGARFHGKPRAAAWSATQQLVPSSWLFRLSCSAPHRPQALIKVNKMNTWAKGRIFQKSL
jgi:hypothetical protein